MERFNIFAGEPEFDATDPEGYRAGMARFGKQLGAKKSGASLYELPTGQSICPYHYEAGEEEWLIVLEGRPTVRHPGGEDELEPGDTVCFAEGPDGGLEASLPDAYAVGARFKLPLRIPGRVVFSSRESAFAVHDAESGRPHLTGSID